MEVWLTKLETHLQQSSQDDVRRLLDKHEMQIPVAAYQGGLLTSQGSQRQEAWKLFQSRLELCRDLQIATLVLAGDLPAPLQEQDLERAQVSLRDAARRAGEAGIRLALEFQADAAIANNLQTAAAWVAELGEPALGICLDAFHFWTGPSKMMDLGYLNPQNLFHVQLCDLADTPRELARDANRILPGDGDLPLEVVADALRQIEYTGPVSVELMNPQLWQIPPRQMGEIALASLRKVLGN